MTKQGEGHPLQAHEGRQGSATRTASWEKLSYLMRNQLVGAPPLECLYTDACMQHETRAGGIKSLCAGAGP